MNPDARQLPRFFARRNYTPGFGSESERATWNENSLRSWSAITSARRQRWSRTKKPSIALIGSCLQVIDDAVTGHGGRVFNTAGDALLAEFPSAVNALKAAMAARGTLSSVDGLDPKCVRFGLHLADVVDIDGDLRGDGVNLASRIQSAAKPGEIEVSGSIVDNVKRNSPCFLRHHWRPTVQGRVRSHPCLSCPIGDRPFSLSERTHQASGKSADPTQFADRHAVQNGIVRR